MSDADLPPDEVEALIQIAKRDGVLIRERALPMDLTEDQTVLVTPIIRNDVN